jgi:hypothetical protein
MRNIRMPLGYTAPWSSRMKNHRKVTSTRSMKVLRNLRNNENIVILKADKGGATVVMNTMDYNTKMIEHLTTTGSYKKLDNNLDERMKKRLTPSFLITPRIYGLPKMHKEGVPPTT